MVTATKVTTNRRTVPRRTTSSPYEYVTARRGRALLDRQARRYLNMSGAEFRAAFRAGTIDSPDRPEVVRVAMLLPFADG